MIRIRTRKSLAPEVSMAPLIDCVLLLLIFILLTSSFMHVHVLKIQLPSSSSSERPDRRSVEILIHENGTITCMGQNVTPEQLTDLLNKEITDKTETSVIMVADRNTAVGIMTDVIDAVRAAKLNKVAIATKPKEQKQSLTR